MGMLLKIGGDGDHRMEICLKRSQFVWMGALSCYDILYFKLIRISLGTVIYVD